jgi:CheY-like chemotaxis protein
MNKTMLLIVDDNKKVRRMIRSLVEDLDGEIFECADGAEAVAACASRQPDWVLMDVHMEQMDGLTATRQIKSVSPQVNIVIVTNHTDAKTRQAATDAGANAFLSKDNLMSLRDLIVGD